MAKALSIRSPGLLRPRSFALSTEFDNARFNDPLQINTNWTSTKHYLGHIITSKALDSSCWRSWGVQHYPLVSILCPASSTKNFSNFESHVRRT